MAGVDFTQDMTVNNGGFGESVKDSSSSMPNEDRKLFIGGLSFETREPQLKEYFEKFGEVETVNLKMNPMTGKSRCFAFVVFKEASSVVKVLDAGEHAINSKKVDVKRSKPKPGKLFIGGLKASMTDDDIRSAFSKFGTIIDFDMPMDKVKKIRKGFGFITYEREDTMKEVLKKGQVQVGEHHVDLRKATPRQDFGFGGPGGGNFGSGGGVGGYSGYGGGYGGGGMDFYGGGPYGSGGTPYGDYYGGGGGAYGDVGGSYGGGAWGPYSMSAGGGKMRGGGSGGGVAKRGGAPY